jgi:RND superfamily putative drug exporter
MTERIGLAAARHPWRAVGAWFVVLVLASGAIVTLLSLESEQRLTNDPESYRAEQIAFESLPTRPEVEDLVVVRSDRYTVGDSQFQRFLRERVQRLEESARVVGEPRPSADEHAVLVPLVIEPPQEERIEDVIDLVQEADRDPDFDAAITGEWTIDRDFLKLSQNDLKEGEAFFGGPAAFVVLLIVFGALVAASVPLLLALVSIVVGLGLAALISQAWELSIFMFNMLAAVGLALGVDYALFVLSRYREERAAGRDTISAIGAAGATSSRAVLFSGTAFVIALAGMLLVPDSIMRSLATGAILAGLVSVAGALTLLPALLRLLGDRVDSLRVPILGRTLSTTREGAFWSRVAAAVMRRPLASLVAGSALLLVLALPVLDMRTGFASVSTFPDDMVSKRGLEAVDRDFRAGEADPVQIVVRGDPQVAATELAVQRLRLQLEADPAFGTPRIERGEGTTVITSPLRGAATDPLTVAKVRQVRSEYVPEAQAFAPDAEILVGGITAENVDYFDTMERWLPIVIAFVLALSLVLLTVAFRSVVVAVKAILLNLLSVGAAYGLLVAVFQNGWGAGLLGFTQVDSIVAWVPLFLFSVLFGLSMDYHVFLLSRIRERYARTRDNSEAVAHGIGTTSRLITGAALIIIVVFVGFSTGDLVMFQQMGFGVAVALLIDATLVRSVLVPAAMELLGDRNWYLPRRLEWLPDVHMTD